MNTRFAIVRTGLTAGLLVAALLSPVAADTVKLKNGTTLTGKIIDSTDPNTVSIEVPIKPGSRNKDLKVLPKADVVSMVKEGPDDAAANAVKALLPTGDMLRLTDYKKLITEGPEAFLAKYPTSKRAAEVQSIKKTLEDEVLKVRTGSVKVEGKWLTGQERIANEYNLNAYAAFNDLNRKAQLAQYRDVLNDYQKLEADAKFSTYLPKAIDLASATCDKYLALLNDLIKTYPAALKERDDKLKNLNPDQMTRAKDAIKKEEATFKAQLDQEKKDKIKFTSIEKLNLPSLQEAAKQVTTEKARLAKQDKAAIAKSAGSFAEVLKLVAEKKLVDAQRRFEEFIEADKSASGDTYMKAYGLRLKKDVETQRRDDRNRELLEKEKGAATPEAAKPAEAPAAK